MRILITILGLATALFFTACKREAGTVLGKAPAGDVKYILAVRAGDTAPNITLHGTLIEKCPIAGCWFRLQDSTGIIKVDTKAAGFAVTGVPVQTAMTVRGRVVLDSEGNETFVEATGLRY